MKYIDMVKVKCPKCGDTWFTNITEQRCVRYKCTEVISKIKHKVEEKA